MKRLNCNQSMYGKLPRLEKKELSHILKIESSQV